METQQSDLHTTPHYVFFDIGMKHFCFLVCELIKPPLSESVHQTSDLKIVDFQVLALTNYITDTISLLHRLQGLPQAHWYIESQNYKNTRCVKIETVIVTFASLKKISFTKVQPYKKLKILDIDSSSYNKRKSGVVAIGEKIVGKLASSNDLCPQHIMGKIQQLKKKDDFYDCILMAVTELLSDGKIQDLLKSTKNQSAQTVT
jgi:hypothetical protein